MGKKLKLTKLALETKEGKEIQLDLDEARELWLQLDSLFGIKKQYFPATPVIIERDVWRPPYQPMWYSSNSTSDNKLGALNVQCRVSGDSGLSVLYSGLDV